MHQVPWGKVPEHLWRQRRSLVYCLHGLKHFIFWRFKLLPRSELHGRLLSECRYSIVHDLCIRLLPTFERCSHLRNLSCRLLRRCRGFKRVQRLSSWDIPEFHWANELLELPTGGIQCRIRGKLHLMLGRQVLSFWGIGHLRKLHSGNDINEHGCDDLLVVCRRILFDYFWASKLHYMPGGHVPDRGRCDHFVGLHNLPDRTKFRTCLDIVERL